MARGGMEEEERKGAWCCCCTFLIVGCILLGTSFGLLNPLQVGLRYNPNTYNLDTSEVWYHGRHCIGPGQYFIKFPQDLQSIYFSETSSQRLECWTKDKQEITLEINVLYKIQASSIADIYARFQENYHFIWTEMVRAAVKMTSIQFDTTDFFTNRRALGGNLTEFITNALANQGVVVHSVQLGAISIPSAFEAAVTDKVVTQQNQTTQLYERNVTLVERETEVIEADAERIVAVTLADAHATALVLSERAQATALLRTQEAYAAAYNRTQALLDFDEDQLIKFIWARSLTTASSDTDLLIGFDDTVLNVQDVSSD